MLLKFLNKQLRADIESTFKSIDLKYYSNYFILPFLVSKKFAALHYCIWGWKKKYNPSESFCTYYYLIKYPDIRENNINPLAHYLTFGIKEKRSCNFQTEREYFEFAPKFTFRSTAISKAIDKLFINSNEEVSIASQYFDIGEYRRGLRFWKTLFFPAFLKLHYFIKGSKNKISPTQIFKPWQTTFQGEVFEFLDQFELNKILGIKISESYYTWRKENEGEGESTMLNEINLFNYKPLISIIIPVFNPNINYFKEAISSVKNQIYTNWELCISDDKSTDAKVVNYLEELSKESNIKVVFRNTNGHISACSNSALKLASGDYIALLDQDDLLSQNALFEVAKKLNENPEIKLLFSNEDKINESGVRFDPYFKKGWNYHLLLSQNYISHLGVYKKSTLDSIGGFRIGYEGSQDYDLVLRFIEQIEESEICFIDKVLYHWRAIEGSTALNVGEKNYAIANGLRALQDHLNRTNQDAIALNADNPIYYRVQRKLKQEPLVTVIVPTKNHAADLRVVINSLFDNNNYENIELIVVDHDSKEQAAIDYLKELSKNAKIKVLHYSGEFNFSAINNYAVNNSTGKYLLFLNNDVEAINKDWLTEMVSQIEQDSVAIVGAKLLYPDNTIQHAGVELGLGGVAGHLYCKEAHDFQGDFGRAQLLRNCDAVTGACLLCKKHYFEQVGGFNDVDLKVAFNDVDLCLKISNLGKLIVYTPYSKLYHYESKSRGSDETKKNIRRFLGEKNYMKSNWNIKP